MTVLATDIIKPTGFWSESGGDRLGLAPDPFGIPPYLLARMLLSYKGRPECKRVREVTIALILFQTFVTFPTSSMRLNMQK